jgi:glycine hydroxymethyltransferase
MTNLQHTDPAIFKLIQAEEVYQQATIRLIASENYTSKSVLEACGTVFQNKYSEGYPGARYYQGQINCDALELLAISRAKALFGAEHVNVQPYSGSPANLAVYLAFAKPGDTVLGLNLSHGGHLTHGSKASVTGKWFNAVHYSLNAATGLIDYDEVRRLTKEHQPKILIAGHSAYPRQLDFAQFRSIADEVGAILLVDMAHFAGLVAGGAHPSPIPFADVVTTTTHKTLRGPRGAIIMCLEKHAKAIDKAVFPGLQGGPHNATTAGIAVALQEAALPAFKDYAHKTVKNAQALAGELISRNFKLVSGGTDNHLMLIDLSNQNLSGNVAAVALEKAGIVVNSNTVPGETRKASDPSGIRIGTPAVTSRGFGVAEMKQIALWIESAIAHHADEAKLAALADQVAKFCAAFPVPGIE